jgi:hypothetical protein
MPATEFLRWGVYFEEVLKHATKEDWYAAQIACEVRRVLHSDPAKLEIDDFLIPLTLKRDGAPTTTPTPTAPVPEEVTKQRQDISKSYWNALTSNIKVKRPPKRELPRPPSS